MAYNDISCVSTLGVTGLASCMEKLGHDAMLIFTTLDFSFASESSAETEADWQTGIDAETVFPFPQFDEIEPALEDDVGQDFPTGVKLFVREGKYGGIGRFETSICNLARLRTFNEAIGRAFIVTANNKIFGTSPDGAIFKGFKLSQFHISKLGSTDGSTNRMVELKYQFKQPSEMADYPAVPQTTWDPLDLVGLYAVTVTISASSSTEVTCAVTKDCDGTAITGLVVADFLLIDDADGAEVINSATDNEDGTYTLDVETLGADDYILNLNEPADQTTGGYKAGTAATFTVE